LYNESTGEKGSCKEKEDNNLRCSDVLRAEQCTQADIKSFDDNCMWEATSEACVAKNSFKGGMQCIEFGTDFCDRFEGCAVVGGMRLTKFLVHSFFDLGVCVDHPCPDDFSLGDMSTCPFGCVINESPSLSLSKNNKQLQHIPKEITNNISHLNPPNNALHNSNNTSFNDHLLINKNPSHNSNNTSLDNRVLMDDLQPICVLELCAPHSVTDCLNHTEDTCFPFEDGCRFLFLFVFTVNHYQSWELFIIQHDTEWHESLYEFTVVCNS
jgi:hypothetical protein